MRVIFLGSPDYAARSLRAIAASAHETAGVVTQPARASGRGRTPRPTAVAAVARELSLAPVIEAADVNSPDVVGELSTLAADIIVTIAFGQILGEGVLELCPRGAVNAHGSLLPRHRGASPVQAAILAGDRRTGVTVMRMVPRMDAGAVISQEAVELTGTETAGELHDTLAGLSARMLVGALDAIEAGAATETPQDESQASYCARISKSDGRVDFAEAAAAVERKVRAFNPWPGAWADLPVAGSAERVTFTRVEVGGEGELSGEPGLILAASGANLEIACGSGSVRVVSLKPAGKREMSAAEYLRGHRVTGGGRAGRS